MEHIQMHPPLNKVKKIYIILTILVNFFEIALFHETKTPLVDMKVQIYSNFSPKNLRKNTISNFYEEWKL